MKSYNRLTWALVNGFAGKKDNPGLLRLIYNMKTREFFAVPPDYEHVGFVRRMLNITEDEIKNGEVDVSYLIPVTLDINIVNGLVRGCFIGVSGLANLFKAVRYHEHDLKETEVAAKNFVDRGEIPLDKDFRIKITERYAYK